MITKTRRDVNFGDGSVLLRQREHKSVPTLSLENIQAKEVGYRGEDWAPGDGGLRTINLRFYNVESMDVLILALQQLKEDHYGG